MANSSPFWQTKRLEQMSRAEWESLCDGCGKCCLHKLIDEDAPLSANALEFTDVSCRLLDTQTGLCSDYSNRLSQVPDCVVLTPENLADVYYMPNSCAYRRIAEGRGLAAWHPLLHDGSRQPMMDAGISAAGRCKSELDVKDDLEDRIVTWPLYDSDH